MAERLPVRRHFVRLVLRCETTPAMVAVGRSVLLPLLVLLALGWPRGAALASGGPATDAYDDVSKTAAVDLHLFGDLYVLHNFNDPASRLNQLREFDFNSNQASLSYARITIAHHPQLIGFRLDLGLGDTAQIYEQQDPAATAHPELARALSHVEQAFATVMVPVKPKLEVDVGRFATPMGFEDNESLSNWPYSRSLLYSWAEPSLHTGLRLSCQATDTLAFSAFWVNGWNSIVVDGNDMRTLAAAGAWALAPGIAVIVVDMAGPERPPTQLSGALSFRNLLAAYGTYEATKQLSFALAFDYGNDRANGGVDWWGTAGYARLQARPWLAGALRAEYYADPSGFMTGTPQRVGEVTTTLEVQRVTERLRLVARLEYRHDQSSALVFDSAIPAVRESRQDTLTLALLAAFRSSD
jgi:hypothetical protein